MWQGLKDLWKENPVGMLFFLPWIVTFLGLAMVMIVVRVLMAVGFQF